MVNVLLNIVNAALMVYIFTLFFNAFSERRLGAWLHLSSLLFITCVFSLVLIFVDNKILNTALLFSLALVISFLYKSKWYNSVLLTFLAYALGVVAEIITTALLSALFSVDTQTAVEGPFFIMGLLLSKFIMYLIIFFIRIKKKRILFSGSLEKLPVIISIPCSTIAILLLQYYYFMVIPIDEGASVLPSLLCYVFLIFSNIVVLDILEHLYRDIEKENQLAFAKKLIEQQKTQYKELREHNERVLKIRHDHKNFLYGLMSRLEHGGVDTAMEYLRSQCRELDLPYGDCSGTGIIDSIVRSKSESAQKNGITIEFSHNDIKSIKISEIDLAIILGNALDNAIEATCELESEDEKRISLAVKLHNNQIIIAVKNKLTADVDVENLKTTKKDSALHGFGIPSIQDLARKYDGSVMLSCADREFCLYVVLKNN